MAPEDFAIPARHESTPGNRLKAKPMADGRGGRVRSTVNDLKWNPFVGSVSSVVEVSCGPVERWI